MPLNGPRLQLQCSRRMTLRGATETNVLTDFLIFSVFSHLWLLNVPEIITSIPLFNLL